MTDPTPLSPAAQAVWDAAWQLSPVNCGSHEDRRRQQIAAALRAAAVKPYEIDLPLSKVVEWEKIKGTCASYYAAAKWGYEQALAHINTIATELENHV